MQARSGLVAASLSDIYAAFNNIYVVAAAFCDVALLLLYILLNFSGSSLESVMSSLVLVGIELSLGAVLTLVIVERALKMDEQRTQFRFAFYARNSLCSYLAQLTVIAHMRIVDDDRRIPSLQFMDPHYSDDLCLKRLFLHSAEENTIDDMRSVTRDISNFDSIIYVGGNIEKPDPELFADLIERLDSYMQDSAYIRRDLPLLIDRAINASDADHINLLHRLYRTYADCEGLMKLTRKRFEDSGALIDVFLLSSAIITFFKCIEPIYVELDSLEFGT